MGVAALTVAAAHFGVGRAALAKSTSEARIPATTPGTNTSFAAIKQIDAGVLNIGYAEAGASDAPVVILLHGWPYDIHTYVDVAPLLAKAGYRVVVPYLRGYGTTRFLSPDTPRNGQQAAIAADIVALMDALGIEKAVIAGCDWGARTANIIAALWPERCKALVSVSGYLIGSRETNKNLCRRRRSLPGGTSSTSPRNAGARAMNSTGRTSPNSSGSSHRRNGILTTPPSIEALRPWTTRIMSISPSIITAGGSALPTARANMTGWKTGLPNCR